MNARKWIAILTAFSMLLVLVSTSAAQSVSTGIKGSAVDFPWKKELFDEDVSVRSISTAFGGPNQIAMMSYITTVGDLRIITEFTHGQIFCGPGDTWTCLDYDFDINGSQVSDIAEVPIMIDEDYRMGWAYYKTNGRLSYHVRGFTVEGNFSTFFEVVDAMVLDATVSVVGRPSLAFDSNGRARIAAVLKDSSDNHYDLVYYHYTGSNNNSCGRDSYYQCDTIFTETSSSYLAGSPIIQVNSNGDPKIIFKLGIGENAWLFYAYPANSNYHPNCGPGTTWRCISLLSDQVVAEDGIDMDMGSSQPQVVYTYSTTGGTNLIYAERVGLLGGNCGQDYVYNPISGTYGLANTWKCTIIAYLDSNMSVEDVSIQVDSQNDPVIVYRDTIGDYSNLQLFRGDPSSDFTELVLDQGGPVGSSHARLLDLALNSSDMGFVGYLEDLDYSTNLKIIYQVAKIYLPAILR